VRKNTWLGVAAKQGVQAHCFITMGVGRKGAGGAWPPWILKISAKKGCFLNFEWEKKNFTTFVLPLKKFWKNPLVAPPWEKSFRRPRS